jgi:hypothetical protein
VIRRVFLFLVSFAALAASGARAGEFSWLTSPNVTVAPVAPVIVVRDHAGKLLLHFTVNSGFHINSNQPKSDSLVPTTLTLEAPNDMMIDKVSYPPGQDYQAEWMTEGPLSVYNGSFDISAQITPAKEAELGTSRVHGTLRYQACDNRQCYPPKKLPVEFDVKVVRPRTIRSQYNPGQSPHIHAPTAGRQ